MPISLQPIATVQSPFTREGERLSRGEILARIVVREDLAEGLAGIEEWSHLIVLFWMHQLAGTPCRLTTRPHRRDDVPEVGVFATRSRSRPNPIGFAIVELLARDANVLTVKGLDAYDGSQVLDIKPYNEQAGIAEIRAPAWSRSGTGRS